MHKYKSRSAKHACEYICEYIRTCSINFSFSFPWWIQANHPTEPPCIPAVPVLASISTFFIAMSTGSALSSKKEGQTGRRPVWAAKIYTCPLMRTMMKSSSGPQLQGGEASEYLWDCFRGLCSSPKSWALSMVCWAGWAGPNSQHTVNIQSTYSQHDSQHAKKL